MAKPKKDPERENRIDMEVVVDAYDREERMMGWYYYLGDTMQYPWTATCKARRKTSPLKVGETVEVTGMADFEDCEREMHVEICWDEDDTLAVPLAQLDPVDVEDEDTIDEDTIQAVQDWHYWVDMGYEF